MLQPKRTKFRKMHKGRACGIKKQNLHFGSFGVQSLVTGRLQASVIEAMRRVMTRKLKRQGQIWIRVSQIFQLVKNQQKYVWVKEKALHLFGFAVFKKVKYFLSLTVYQSH